MTQIFFPSSRQDFLPADIQTQFAVSRELIRNVYNSFYKLRDRAERIASRAIDNAADLLIFGKELRQVALLGSMGLLGWKGALDFNAGLGAEVAFTIKTHFTRKREAEGWANGSSYLEGKRWSI